MRFQTPPWAYWYSIVDPLEDLPVSLQGSTIIAAGRFPLTLIPVMRTAWVAA